MISGERIRLRPIERQDLPQFVAWLSDAEVRRGLALYLPFSNAEEERWFEDTLKEPRDERPLAIEVESDEGWKMNGGCGYQEIEWRNRGSEVGSMIGDKSCWNQGIGTQVMRQAEFRDGRYWDVLVMSVLRSEWQERG